MDSETKGTGKTYGAVYAVVTNNYSALTEEQKRANAEYIYNELSNEGWSTEAICGLLGNIEHESQLNPGQWQKNASNAGYGIVQWTTYK